MNCGKQKNIESYAVFIYADNAPAYIYILIERKYQTGFIIVRRTYFY